MTTNYEANNSIISTNNNVHEGMDVTMMNANVNNNNNNSVYEMMNMLAPSVSMGTVAHSIEELNTRRAAIMDAWKEFRTSKSVSKLVIEISLDENYIFNTRLVYRAVVPQIAHAMKETPVVFKQEDNTVIPDKKVCLDVLALNFADPKAYTFSTYKFFLYVHKEEFVTVFMQVSTAYRGIGEDRFADLRTFCQDNKSYTREELLAQGIDIDSLPSYGGKEGCQIVSKGGLKTRTALLVRNDTDVAKEAMNMLSMGMLEAHIGEEIPTAKAIKLATRLSSHMSPEFGREIGLGAVAVYMGKYFNSQMDGQSFTVLLQNGYASHGRAYTEKDQLIGLSDMGYKAVLNRVLKEADGVVWYVRGTNDELKANIMSALAGNKESSVYGKVVIIADYEGQIPEILGDLNSFKETWDIDRISGFNSQGLYHNEYSRKNTVAFSTQSVYKAMGVLDPAARETFVKMFLRKFRDNLIAKVNNHKTFSDIETFVNVLSKDATRALLSIDETVEERFSWLRRKQLEDILKAAGKDIQNLSIDVAGLYKLAQADPAIIFGQEVLKVGEIIVDDLDMVNKQVLLFKDPSTGLNEYVAVRCVSKSEYKARIGVLQQYAIISTEEAQFLCDYVEFMNPDAAIVSANGKLKQMLAGFDFDTDHLRIVTDEELVKFFVQYVPSIAVVIDASQVEAESNGKLVKVGYDIMAQAQAAYDALEIKDVGAVTNLWKLIQTMYINQDLESFKQFLIRVIGNNEKKHGKYVPLCTPVKDVDGIPVVEIGLNKIQKMISMAEKMELSEDNLRTALYDFVVAIPRHDQEIIIDAAGHGYEYHVLGDLETEMDFAGFRSEILDDEEIRFAVDTKTASIKVSGKISDVWGSIKHLQHLMATVTLGVLKDEVRRIFTTAVKLQKEEADACISVFRNLPKATQKELARTIRTSWNISGLYGKLIRNKKYTQDEANDIYRQLMTDVENEIRRLTIGMDGANRFAAVMAMTQEGVSGKTVLRNGMLAAMGRTILKEEMAEYLLKTSENVAMQELANQIDWSSFYALTDTSRMIISIRAKSEKGTGLQMNNVVLTWMNKTTAKNITAEFIQISDNLGQNRAALRFNSRVLPYYLDFHKEDVESKMAVIGTKAVVDHAYYCGTNAGYCSAIVILDIQ